MTSRIGAWDRAEKPFTPETEYEAQIEWFQCKNTPASRHRPRGWKKWNLDRILRDSIVSEKIAHPAWYDTTEERES